MEFHKRGGEILSFIRIFDVIIRTILRFTKKEADPFDPARYIRSFDVISEVLLRRRRKLYYIQNIVLYTNPFLEKTGVLSVVCNFFSQFVFIEAPPRFLLETKSFASTEDSLGFSALCELQEKFFRFFLKDFSLNSSFERFSVEQNQFPSFKGNNWLFVVMWDWWEFSQ